MLSLMIHAFRIWSSCLDFLTDIVIYALVL